MKKFILLAALGIAAANYQPAKAQINVSINVGSQPQWGPRGYDYVDYYYLPEVQSYYHVPSKKFIYLDKNKWVHRKSLPKMYRGYNLYQGRKIVINQPRPYLQHQRYFTQYSRSPVRYRHSDKYKDDRKKSYNKYEKNYRKYNKDRYKKYSDRDDD